MVHSRNKGKRGELDFAKLLKAHNLDACRGQQFKGGAGSPDVICKALSDIHFEVKYTERCLPYVFMGQATIDAGDFKKPIVAYRRANSKWIGIVPMEFLLELLILREGSQI